MNDNFQWILCLIPVLAIGIVAFAMRIVQGSWLAPGAAWAGFWFLASLIPLITAPELKVSPAAVWVIFLFTAVIAVTSHIGLLQKASSNSTKPRGSHLRPNKQVVVPAFALISIASLLLAVHASNVMLREVGLSGTSLSDFAVLQSASKQLSDQRYTGNQEPLMVRICLIFVYFTSLASGHMLALKRTRYVALLSLLPVVGALQFAILTTAKSSLMFTIIFWLSAWIATHLAKWGTPPIRLRLRTIILLSAAGTILIWIFVLTMSLRYGSEDVEDRAFVISKLKSYFVAHLSVFSAWWDYINEHGYTMQLGRASLFGVADHLGLAVRKAGGFDFVYVEGYTADSNVFSIYRGLIEDFSLIGALTGSAIGAFIAGTAYAGCRNEGALGARLFLTAFYAVLLCSHVINPFGYTSLIAAFLLYIGLGICVRVLTQNAAAKT
jgi:oligosaccharide repeat unit polymerase